MLKYVFIDIQFLLVFNIHIRNFLLPNLINTHVTYMYLIDKKHEN